MSAMAITNPIPFSFSFPSLFSSSSPRSLHRPHPPSPSPQALTLTLALALVPSSSSTSRRSSSSRWRRRRVRGSGGTLAAAAASSSSSSPAEELSAEEEWLRKLPEKKKPLYSHSLPCIEAWLRQLGFRQSRDDRAVWLVEKPLWHAQLSLDVTDLYIRYLKSGPGNLEKDVERRFSYALSREDIENAILGGP